MGGKNFFVSTNWDSSAQFLDNYHIILYGAGYCGAMMAELLKEQEIAPICFFDRNPSLWRTEIFGIPVIAPAQHEEFPRALIIVCILAKGVLFEKIQQDLKMLGYENVIHIYDLREDRMLFQNQNIIISPNKAIVDTWRDHFSAMESALADETSKQLLHKIERFLQGNVDVDFDARPISEQYFSYDIYRRIPNEVVIDAGGFKGEVMDWFMQYNKGRFDEYHIVEPDCHYHEEIARCAEKWGGDIRLYPCALSDRKETLRLRNYANANSVVKPDGEIAVEAYPIDFLFPENRCTFLKIDVEGYERKVLEGGKELLCRNRPVIAVGTYHYETEFFELFEWISSLIDGYSFFLRSYMNIQETVLYAVPETRRARV